MNYNIHPETQIEALAESLDEFGQVSEIIVWEDVLVAGHGIVEAARRLKWNSLKAIVLPAEWDQQKVDAYMAVDNETARMSRPDKEQLKMLLRGVDDTKLRALAAGGEEKLKRLIQASSAAQTPTRKERVHQAVQQVAEEEGLSTTDSGQKIVYVVLKDDHKVGFESLQTNWDLSTDAGVIKRMIDECLLNWGEVKDA